MKLSRLLTWTVLALVVVGIAALAVYRLNGDADQAEAAAAAPRPARTVAAVRVEAGDVRAWVFADGTARASRREYLTFEEAGRVTYVWPGPDGGALRVGETTPKGQVLARLDAREQEADIVSAEAAVAEARQRAGAARADLTRVEADRGLARATLDRTRELRKRGTAPAVALEEARAALAQAEAAVEAGRAQVGVAEAGIATAEARLSQARVGLERRELVSPIAGTIAYLNIEQGYYFTPSIVRTESESAALQSVPIVVIDGSTFEVIVDVPSYAADAIKVEQKALLVLGEDFRVAAIGDPTGGALTARPVTDYARAQGKVFAVSPAVNPGGRSVQVKIRTTEGSHNLRDGMYVTALIATQESQNAVVVPFNALVYRQDEPFVFVIDPKTGTAGRRGVRLGIRGLDAQEVVSGLKAGERVVTEGRFQLTDGAPVDLVGDGDAPVSDDVAAGDGS